MDTCSPFPLQQRPRVGVFAVVHIYILLLCHAPTLQSVRVCSSTAALSVTCGSVTSVRLGGLSKYLRAWGVWVSSGLSSGRCFCLLSFLFGQDGVVFW